MLSPALTEARRSGSATIGNRSLSPARQRLLALLAHIHFGRLLDLHVRAGEPVFDDTTPRVVRTVKLAGTKQLCARTAGDPLLKREIVDLLHLLDSIGDGVIGRVEIAHGIPLFAEVHESAPAA